MSHGMPRELGMEPAVGGHGFFDLELLPQVVRNQRGKNTHKETFA